MAHYQCVADNYCDIKQEVDECLSQEAKQQIYKEELYVDHIIKEELVIGPVEIQELALANQSTVTSAAESVSSTRTQENTDNLQKFENKNKISTNLHENYSNYRYCIVRECKNTSLKTPGKLWIRVPSETNIRKTWLSLAQRDPESLSTATQISFCEDHFDLEKDMENYMQYKIMGSVKRIRMKRDCVPSKFVSQNDKKSKHTSTPDDLEHAYKKRLVMPLSEDRKLVNLIEISSASFHQGAPFVGMLQPDESNKRKERQYKLEIGVMDDKTIEKKQTVLNYCDDKCDNKVPSIVSEPPTFPRGLSQKQEFVDSHCQQKYSCDTTSKPDFGAHAYACAHCKYSCNRRSTLIQHLRTHTGKKPFKCSYCKHKCSTKGNLNQHLRLHTGEKPHSCSYCEYSCKKSSDLKIHLRKHTGEKPYSCSHCKYSCSTNSALKIHIRTHTGEKPYSCLHCEYRCSLKGSLLDHLKRHTGEKPYHCTNCEYRCSTNSDLKKHLKIHTGEKRYSCSQCNYTCITSGALKIHVKRHTGEKQYNCLHCEYRCNQKGRLKDHLKTHTGEKPYSCPNCEYRCGTNRALKIHLRMHTGEKPHSCSYCEYRCTTTSALTVHLRRHTGEKPYSCSYCGYSCVQRGNLVSHLKRHTREKPYCIACPDCK